MGIYANDDLKNWFVEAYKKQSPKKLDVGKSCIRFKNMETIPYDLIGELCTKMTIENWITMHEQNTH